MVNFDMNPQEALDHPRFQLSDGRSDGSVALEDGIPVTVMSDLVNRGHKIVPRSGFTRISFGRGQIIRRDPESGVLSGGSDPRADGQALAW